MVPAVVICQTGSYNSQIQTFLSIHLPFKHDTFPTKQTYAYLVFTSTGISFLMLVSTFLVFCFTGTVSFSGFSAVTFPFCFSGSYKRCNTIITKSIVPLASEYM